MDRGWWLSGKSTIRQGKDRWIAKLHWQATAADRNLITAAPDLLAIARRWAAIDGSAWHVERYDAERARLLADTSAAISKAEGQ